MKQLAIIALMGGLFLTANQQGQRLKNQERYAEAAEAFEDPMRRGTAWYRAGEFKKAAMEFQSLETPEAFFNRGNCQIFLGKYEDAIKSYDQALALKPDWDDALLNREIAEIRAKALEKTGGDMGDQKIGADEIRFDNKKNGGQETNPEQTDAVSDQGMQAVWLRRVQTDPADFLKAKFSYQHAMEEKP